MGSITSRQVLLTSAAGARRQPMPAVTLSDPAPFDAQPRVCIRPDRTRHAVTGIGGSFTQASAFVLAHLSPSRREAVMQQLFSQAGAGFSLARTHIGACDFCVEGRYSYADTPAEPPLSNFSIAPDLAGFDPQRYPGLQDPGFGLLAMIQSANRIRAAEGSPPMPLIASAWTAPPWMKDIEDWYRLPGPENGYRGRGGVLKSEHEATYADYLLRYLAAYRAEGVPIWGLTPVNEPHGNNGQWESLEFTPESQRDFIAQHLGPGLKAAGFDDVNLLIYDQNRSDLLRWADTILGDPAAAQYVYGTAVHWYDSTVRVFEDEIAEVRSRYPERAVIHTEGCIDDLGKSAPAGIADPVGFQESGWFANDAFWWSRRATDWAYTASWAPRAEDHPMYCPVHRYARDILVGLNAGLSGWVDWNMVLDAQGGPNHVGNFCGAPIMIDTQSGDIHYTPVFHVLSQLSSTIRPSDRVVDCTVLGAGLEADTLHSCATVSAEGLLSIQLLNTSDTAIPFGLQVGDHGASLVLPANAVQTLQFPRAN